MTRRHPDPVEVRGTGDRPTHFLWHDRVYAVREVLGHWREGVPRPEGARRSAAPAAGRSRPVAEAPPPAAAGRIRAERTGREVWRVEASPGRAFAAGVYDLSLDPAGRWTLTRTAD
ncbi:DUF6504 family protein [Streptacidiphilus sp. ASG 303]|uniref:DUF6504 family protein n=1 Tax=Streptacidiphilus sp. ASG 303 TaxID=2896847 RepID=UPI001E28F33A|nr:DUF6504 family protein [Streptacidiphilus sp. ASG 303]MCD0481644.1 DUF6504 family protein [Streptacidiphilus sp. ASG 303]